MDPAIIVHPDVAVVTCDDDYDVGHADEDAKTDVVVVVVVVVVVGGGGGCGCPQRP